MVSTLEISSNQLKSIHRHISYLNHDCIYLPCNVLSFIVESLYTLRSIRVSSILSLCELEIIGSLVFPRARGARLSAARDSLTSLGFSRDA